MKPRLNDAVVNAGCLLFLAHATPIARHSDYLDSLLYVQLAATRKHARFSDFGSWKEVWLAAALRFGWTLNASEHVSERLRRAGDETIWTLCAGALRPMVDAQVIDDAERRVAESARSEALDLLCSQAVYVSTDAQSGGRTTVALQLGFVDPEGILALVMLHFATWQPLGRDFMFEPLEAGQMSGSLEATAYSMRLSESVYASFRDPMSTALIDKRPALIRPLRDNGPK